MREAIENHLKKIICNHFEHANDKLSSETSFVYDLGADSVDMVELIMKFEEEFDIEIPNNIAVEIGLGTLNTAVNYIAAESQAKKNTAA